MLTKISALQAHAKPIKYAKKLPHISQQICAISQLNSHRQISALRSVVTDILTKISHDNSIISKINKSNSLINLSENEIGFLDSQKNEIRFSIPKEHNKSLFGIQLIKNNEPTFSVFLDAFGKLIENYTSPELKYIYSDNVDLNILEKVFSEIYTSSDDLLFGLRLNVNNASTREILNLNKINIPSLEHLEYKKPIIENKISEERTAKINIPTDGNIFSYKEVIVQNDKIEQELKNKGIKVKKQIASCFSDYPERKTVKKAKLSLTKEKKEAKEVKTSTLQKSEKPKKIINIALKKEAEVNSAPKKRGRPKKIVDVFIKEAEVNSAPKKRGRPKKIIDTPIEKKEKKVVKPAGIINDKLMETVNKIFEINNHIDKFIKSITGQTRLVIYGAYKELKAGKAQLKFNDLVLQFLRRKTWDNIKALSIFDESTKEGLNILETGKLAPKEINMKKVVSLKTLKLLTQEEIESEQQNNILNSLLTQALEKMEKYKSFIDRKGWRSVERRIASENEGNIEPKIIESLNLLEEKCKKVQSKLRTMNSTKSCYIKRDFGIVPAKSAKFEFTNAFNDGYNIFLNKANTKYGNLTILCKYKSEILEEIFVISENGKLVRNINKNSGTRNIINHNEKQIKFYNDEQIEKENLIPRLEKLINDYDKKLSECEDFIQNYKFDKK